MSSQTATLSRSLKGFDEADTGSASRGSVKKGTYKVLLYKPQYPNANTDYALVEVAGYPGGKAWLCTRWKDQDYATIEKAQSVGITPGKDYSRDPHAIDENELIKLLPLFKNFKYVPTGATYPYELPGINIKIGSENNCCTFAEGLLVKAFNNVHANMTWNMRLHNMMMIAGANPDLFGPVTAAVETNMADPINDIEAPPGPWTLIQGWRDIDKLKGGHTFMIMGHEPSTDKVLTLEATNQRTVNGVGHRGIGKLSDVGVSMPPHWWEDPDVPTWAEMKAAFKDRKMASIKVKNLQYLSV